jgi:hypothetical protein
MNDFNSKFWKVMAVLFVSSIFFLGYAILNGGAGGNAILPQKALAQGSLAPGSGYYAETLGTSIQDAAIFIWKYDDYGVPVRVSVAYRQKDWVSNTYDIKPEDKK